MSSRGRDSGPVVRLRAVSKKYPIYDRPSQRLLELLTLRRRAFHREFWALRDIDLEVRPGVTLGVVGQNGSGKSTLLQVIAGILRQTCGDVQVDGRVSALLELGAGFNPEFTGRENVFMNGAIMGFERRQMEQRLEKILQFAEIGDFIDRPVKTYSSGMFMRLAFAVAIHLDPDILLVDEALAVGDMVFQHRCITRIRQLREEGKTILFVTHDLDSITRFCDRAILLDHGHKLADGSPAEVSQRYRELISERERADPTLSGPSDASAFVASDLPFINTIPQVHRRYGEGNARILGITMRDQRGQTVTRIRSGQPVRVLLTVQFLHPVAKPIVGFLLRDKLGVDVLGSNTTYEGVMLPAVSGEQLMTVAFEMEIPALKPGSYSLAPAVAEGSLWNKTIDDWIDGAFIFEVEDQGLVYGAMRWPVSIRYRIMEAAQGEASSMGQQGDGVGEKQRM